MSDTKDPRLFTTEYLKRVWAAMGDDDGQVNGLTIADGGHTVNGLFMDDVYFELIRRGEQVII